MLHDVERDSRVVPVWVHTGHDEETDRQEILRVLERAAQDVGFVAELTHHGGQALQEYDLTLEARAALLSGDVAWVEEHVGRLDTRLGTWLWCRLQQEVW